MVGSLMNEENLQLEYEYIIKELIDTHAVGQLCEDPKSTHYSILCGSKQFGITLATITDRQSIIHYIFRMILSETVK